MSVVAHVQELRKKHEALSEAVEQAQKSTGTDTLHIVDLKKQKLRIKEEIVRLSSYCLLYTSPSPRDRTRSRMPSSA